MIDSEFNEISISALVLMVGVFLVIALAPYVSLKTMLINWIAN